MNNGHPHPVSTEPPPAADGVLVRRFANCRDEAAFAELVARYRGLVFGVCRRVLQQRQDVEDAFQATFLVLARDAAEIRSRESIAAWLYGVAHRIALHARAKNSRRRETTLNETDAMGLPNPFTELAERSELQALDEELNLLPEKYREPLVLHYLLNRTAPQIAEELKLTQTAVEGRLKRGRNRLRKQLARRGIGLTAILPVLTLCQSSAEASLSGALVDQTIQAGLSFTSTGHSPPLYSHEAANLAAKEIGTMTTTSIGTFTAVALSATAIIGLAVGIAGQTPVPGRSDAADVGTPRLAQSTSLRNAPPAIRLVAADDGGGAGAGIAKPGGDGAAVGRSPKYGTGGAGLGSMGAGGGAVPALRATFDLKPRSAVEQKILMELEKPTRLDFDIGVSLKDAMENIAAQHKIRIIPDKKALSDAQIKLDELQTRFTFSGVQLHSGLRIILKEHHLDYLVRNEVLEITTREAATEYRETRVYDVSHLKADAEALLTIIKENLGVWKDEGDPNGGTISAATNVLVVKQTQRTHREIVDLLQQLGRVPALEIRGRFLGGTSKRKPTRPKSRSKNPGGPRGGAGGFGGGTGGGGGTGFGGVKPRN